MRVVVIPARYASSRFPGKPLASIAGTPMIVHVVQRSLQARSVDRVVVATDDQRIVDTVQAAGFEAVMTGEHASGTDRVAKVAEGLQEAELIVNVQGDEPLVDPRDLDALIADAQQRPEAIHTLVRPLPPGSERTSVVKVSCGPNRRALNFFRQLPEQPRGEILQHVGLYAFTPALLATFAGLDSTESEIAERLEQLRALDNGIPVYVTSCVSEQAQPAVDEPEDIARVEAVLAGRLPD